MISLTSVEKHSQKVSMLKWEIKKAIILDNVNRMG